jgi:hypothetical protein
MGNIEVCLGEVIDSLNLTKSVQNHWNISPTRTVMWGASHGACVTERAVESGAPVSAAAAFSAPTDFNNWYQYCGPGTPCTQYCPPGSPPPPCVPIANVQFDLEHKLGTPSQPLTPNDTLIPYDWRSPAWYASDLAARKDVGMLLVQGNNDGLIEPAQACELASSAWGSSSLNYYFPAAPNSPPSGPPIPLNANGSPPLGFDSQHVYNGALTGCDTSLTWQTGPAPVFSNGSNYLLVYGGADHNGETGGFTGIIFPGAKGVPGCTVDVPPSPAWTDFDNWLKAFGLGP